MPKGFVGPHYYLSKYFITGERRFFSSENLSISITMTKTGFKMRMLEYIVRQVIQSYYPDE